jgi:hypothetical protein
MIAFIVVLIRLLIPFSILRFPFGGALLSIAADTFDISILRAFGWGFLNETNYQAVDKLLDTYYLFFAFYVALKWQERWARKTSIILFSWRFIGVLIFEITGVRKLLFFAPNIFENFYILFLGTPKIFKKFKTAIKRNFILLLIVAAITKLPQEYIMHFLGYPLGLGILWRFIKVMLL